MIKEKRYRYYGENGTIESTILLPDAKHFVMYKIAADKGMILTNGENYSYGKIIPASELDLWIEVEDKGQLK